MKKMDIILIIKLKLAHSLEFFIVPMNQIDQGRESITSRILLINDENLQPLNPVTN